MSHLYNTPRSKETCFAPAITHKHSHSHGSERCAGYGAPTKAKKINHHSIMQTHTSHTIAACTILISGVLSLASIYLQLTGSGFNPIIFSHPLNMDATTIAHVHQLIGGFACQLVGYLFLLPAFIFLHGIIKSMTSWSYFISWSGIIYSLACAIGMGLLFFYWQQFLTPGGMHSISQHDLPDFIIFQKMIGNLQLFTGSIYWIGLGLVFHKQSSTYASICLLLGITCLLKLAGYSESGSTPGIAIVFVFIGWLFGTGFYLLHARRLRQKDTPRIKVEMMANA